MAPAGQRLLTLAQIEGAVWAELEQATQARGHAWRVLALATLDGERAAVRSVVLRQVLAAQQQLLFYTDLRSPKVAQMRAAPLGTLLAWSPALSWQLRLEVHLQVAGSGSAVAAHWAGVQHSASAQDYLAALAPGTPLEGYAPALAPAAQHHFAVVTAQVTAIDWLELHANGHRRARFDEGEKRARWLAP